MPYFLHRTGHILNCFWEKTPENVFYDALTESISKLGLLVEDYTTTEDINLNEIEGKHFLNRDWPLSEYMS